jgi:peptidoglycan/LPS O-acetylase OafA/YrhL
VAGAVGLLILADWASRAWLGDPIYRLPFRHGFLRALPLFLLGVAAALFGARVYVSPTLAAITGIIAFVALVCAQAVGTTALLSLLLLTVMIWAAGAAPVAKPSRLIEHLGLMSFAIFLTNEVVRILWFGVFDAIGQEGWSSDVRWAIWTAGLASAFIGAVIFRYAFDRPVQERFNPPRRPAAAPGVSIERPIA